MKSTDDQEDMQHPIRVRHNPFSEPDRKWYQFWKKNKDYGINITLTEEQTLDAYNLYKSDNPISIKILENQYENIPEPETIEPLLFLMKESGYVDVLENVKSGEFIIQTPKGEKSSWLRPEKLMSVKIGDKYYRAWFLYENCMTPYPEDPLYSADLSRRIIQKVAINYKDINEAAIITAKTKMWLWIIGVIIIGLVLFISTDFGQTLLSGMMNGNDNNVVQTASSAAEQVKRNLTSQVTQQ